MSSAEPTEAVQAKNAPARNQIGLFSSMAIGIGGMVGAGIFSILGVVGEAAGTAMWVSFSIGGAVALMSAYSYAKLGVRYPSAGGAVEFLVKGFGDGVITGGINLYMWIGYVIALALYAQAFAGYFMTFFHPYSSTWLAKTIGISIVHNFHRHKLHRRKNRRAIGKPHCSCEVVHPFTFCRSRANFCETGVPGAESLACDIWDTVWGRGSLHRV